jgi:hypothetical protein
VEKYKSMEMELNFMKPWKSSGNKAFFDLIEV